MITKKPTAEIDKMSRSEIANYITEITQTEICKDVNYCNYILKAFLKK